MSFPLIFSTRDRRRAFTLIELLTVIAIIGVLAGITFGVVTGVQNRAAISQARTELAALAAALESYKRQYGDYPQAGAGVWTGLTNNETKLLQGLLGKRGPQGASINGRLFIDVAKFSLSSTLDPLNSANQDGVKLQDPWGRDYFYFYKSAGWAAPSYMLLSTGPNGLAFGTNATPTTANLLNTNGTIKSTAANDAGAADNIYANQ
jgi:prepilin-type N-terminal cleavage/methylation domain-containing protein